MNLLVDPHEIGARAVHLVDKSKPRNLVFVRLAPDGFGLRLHPAHRTEHRAGPVQDAQRALDLDGEVNVAGSINNIDAMIEDNYSPSLSKNMWWQQK